MVNYNSDNTVTTPPGDVLKIAILERRAYFINAVEEYKKVENKGSQASTHVLASALYGLFLEIQEPLLQMKGKEDFEKLRQRAESPATFKEAVDVFGELSAFLYAKKLTQFDTRRDVDTLNVEAVNLEHGL